MATFFPVLLLNHMILIVANVDFGHTDPMITFPIGGTIQIEAADETQLVVFSH